jgi:hypothetical protein
VRRACRHCGKVQLRIVTDGDGHAVEVSEPCTCTLRKQAGLCRTCPAPLPSPWATYCATCADSRRRVVQRRHANAKRGQLGPVKSPEWRKDVNEAKRLAGVCQLCIRPVEGKPKVALYCARHRALRLKDAQRKHIAKVGNKHQQKFYETHRNEILEKQRERHAKDWRRRKRRAEYKRRWRKENRDKVKAQKRRHALRGKAAEAARRRRERLGDMARVSKKPAPRNERGERLCLAGCGAVMRGRAKMCAACKAGAVPVERAA